MNLKVEVSGDRRRYTLLGRLGRAKLVRKASLETAETDPQARKALVIQMIDDARASKANGES